MLRLAEAAAFSAEMNMRLSTSFFRVPQARLVLLALSVAASSSLIYRYNRNSTNAKNKVRLLESKEKDTHLKSGQVVVSIWKMSSDSKQVGHVSLSINEEKYLSFWPDKAVNLKQKEGKVVAEPAMLLPSLQHDIKAEGVNPNISYSVEVDQEKIEEFYCELEQSIKSDKIGYCMAGKALKSDKKCFNCTTAVLTALEKGGLQLTFFDRQTIRPDEMDGVLNDMSRTV